MRPPPIITCPEWHSKPGKVPSVWTDAPSRIIFHHTAGHHPEIENPRDESRAEAIRYAQDIQAFHMAPKPHGRDWNDSGHNFLVCRNGLILVGRHHSLTAVSQGRMVISAHCPGQNDQVGIEHEHLGSEPMTHQQFESSSYLHAWIIDCCKMRSTGTIIPHSHYFPTACPGPLKAELPALRARVVSILNKERGV